LFAPYLLIAVVFLLSVVPAHAEAEKKAGADAGRAQIGDTVVTSSGITGTVTAIDGDTLILRVKPDNLKLQFVRSAVTSVVTPETAK